MKYKVMLECRTGMTRLIHDTYGTYWEPCYHIITLCDEETEEEAWKIAENQLLYNRIQVRRAWVERPN